MLEAPRQASSTEVPILDLSAWLAGGPPDALMAQLRAACLGTGFFYVKGHGVPRDIINGVFDATRRYYDIPHRSVKQIGPDLDAAQLYDEADFSAFNAGLAGRFERFRNGFWFAFAATLVRFAWTDWA